SDFNFQFSIFNGQLGPERMLAVVRYFARLKLRSSPHPALPPQSRGEGKKGCTPPLAAQSRGAGRTGSSPYCSAWGGQGGGEFPYFHIVTIPRAGYHVRRHLPIIGFTCFGARRARRHLVGRAHIRR